MENKNKLVFIGILCVALLSCHDPKRDFFLGMNSSVKDVPIHPGFYFIKSFELSSQTTVINGNNYWALKNSPDSYFELCGYLRNYHNAIYAIPLLYNNDAPKEYKLFDFNAKQNASWKAVYRQEKNKQYGDSVVLSHVRINKRSDTVYTFRLHRFFISNNKKGYLYNDPVFDLDVSKKNGIISITKLNSMLSDFDYKLVIFPTQSFINKKKILDL